MALVSIDLGQLIDLAVGVNSSSNIGIVNFNLLHLLLHTIVNKTNLTKHCVEIHGNNNNNNNNNNNTRKRLKKIPELLPVAEEVYDDNIESEFIPSSTAADHNNNNVSADLSLLDYNNNNNNNNTSFVVGNNSSVATNDEEGDIRNGDDHYDDDDTTNYNKNNVELINNPNKFQPISMISLNDFNELSRKVSDIQDVVNTVVLPANNDLFENNPDAISTMWNLLNMTKRIDAVELGIEKLSSLFHDLLQKNKEYSDVIETLEKAKCKCNMELLNNISNVENVTNINNPIIDSIVNSQSCKKKDESLSLTGRSPADNETENIRKKTLQDRKIDIFDSKINNLESQLADMDVENRKCNYILAELVEKLQNQKDEIFNLAIICEQIPSIKLDIKKLYEKFNFTTQEIDVIEVKIHDLTNELKRLMEIKINRDEFYDALSEKADYYLVKQKVSTDEFDALKESLLTQLKIALAQLNKSESDFKMALNNLETIVNGKIDGNYLTELESNMMDKLKSLQNRLQALLNLSADSAAGTKSKMLHNLNCISCDANVSMKRKNDILVSKFDEMHTVIKPLISNTIDFATGAADDTTAERLSVKHSEMKKNNNYNINLTNHELLCTRYCGGSHTKISAEQKMMTNKNSLRNKITNKINNLNYSTTYNKHNNDNHSYGCNCQQQQ